ncbi:MAG: hypothetical protein C0432_02585 [Candidatus Puniceispirillum sp.]|nr:hypothetical protein [Candidatus Pelagibacter sp.]MBA4283162.1 hypothetical protein [Candidatus Puniceispirillum sp.]
MISKISNQNLLKMTTLFAIFVSGVLIIAKFYAFWVSGSLGIKASFIDSSLDCFISTLNFFAIKQSLSPPDDKHRFGHGKIEALVGVLQALLIGASSIWILEDIVSKMIHGYEIKYDMFMVKIMLAATFLTLILVLWQRKVIKITQSLAIKADSLHYQTDLMTNTAIIISITCAYYFNWTMLDSITGAFLSFYILKMAYGIGRQSFDILMDAEISKENKAEIEECLNQSSILHGEYKLRTRSYGSGIFVEITLFVDCEDKFNIIDTRLNQIKSCIMKRFNQCEVIILLQSKF